MTLHVVWYDQEKGSTWQLVYDAGGSTMRTALQVTGTGDKQWHDETITVKDAVFQGGGTKGSDIALVNTDAMDDIFSLIEVHRGELDQPYLTPRTVAASISKSEPTKKELRKMNKKKDK